MGGLLTVGISKVHCFSMCVGGGGTRTHTYTYNASNLTLLDCPRCIGFSLSVLMLAAVPLIPTFNHSVCRHGDLSLPSTHLRTTSIPLRICCSSSPLYAGQMWDMGQSAPRGVCHLHPFCQHSAFSATHNER